MQISFGDDAFDSFVSIVQAIPEGYTVALLGEGEELPNTSDLTPGVDVRLTRADHDGIEYDDLDAMGEPTGHTGSRSWVDVARIHVY